MADVDTKARRRTEAERPAAARPAEPPPVLPPAARRRRFHIFPLLITLAVVAVAVWLGRAMWDAYMGAPWTRDGTVRLCRDDGAASRRLQMGDEMRRTQRGNNNAYCQENGVSWLDWSLLDRHRNLHRFVRILIAHRFRLMGAGGDKSFGLSLNELLRRAEIDWHGVQLGKPDWADDSHSIAFTVRSGLRHLPFCLHVMLNAYWEALDFDLPPAPAAAIAGWRRWIDTSRESPEDIMDATTAPPVPGTQYRVAPRSVTALLVRTDDRFGPVIELKPKPA
jgi:hypothetical protein